MTMALSISECGQMVANHAQRTARVDAKSGKDKSHWDADGFRELTIEAMNDYLKSVGIPWGRMMLMVKNPAVQAALPEWTETYRATYVKVRAEG